jgi:hypothetical protein
MLTKRAGTGLSQPFDLLVFGALKAIARTGAGRMEAVPTCFIHGIIDQSGEIAQKSTE